MINIEDKKNELDKWKYIRKNLYRNVEPEVNLIAITQPIDLNIDPEELVAYSARKSHESKSDKYEDNINLNEKLISWGHDTPLEALNFVFDVKGISKSLAGQWTRHRAGIGWVFRSTRYVKGDGNNFVYPAIEYINDEKEAKDIYREYEIIHKQAVENFHILNSLGVDKQECRRVMPVDFSTSCTCFVNARALRHFFKLRMTDHAEWEIRRLSYIMYKICNTNTPSLFEDLIK